jgi:hypothetical protein
MGVATALGMADIGPGRPQAWAISANGRWPKLMKEDHELEAMADEEDVERGICPNSRPDPSSTS